MHVCWSAHVMCIMYACECCVLLELVCKFWACMFANVVRACVCVCDSVSGCGACVYAGNHVTLGQKNTNRSLL